MNRVFVILDLFLPFDPPHNPKNQNFEKSKKCLEILSFYTSVPQMTIIWCMLPEIWSMTVIIFCHFWPFFAFYPTNNPKNQNFEKMKKMHRDFIILDKCPKNHDHMEIWDVTHVKKHLEISSFHIWVPKITIKWCTFPGI